MPQDYTDYFLSRISGPITGSLAGEGKLEALQAARETRVQRLTILKAEQEAAAKSNAESLAGQWGVDASTLGGKAVNLGAAGYSGFSTVIGKIAGTPHALIADTNQASLSEPDIAALNRHAQGVATAEDLIQINRKVAPQVPAGANMPDAQARAQALADGNPNAPTPLKIWGEMNSARATSRAINESFDRSSLIQQDVRTEFTRSLTEGYDPASTKFGDGLDTIKAGNTVSGAVDVVSGVAQLLFNAGKAAVNNKEAVLSYMAENAPQLFLGAAGKVGMGLLTTSNLGYAADTYNEGIEAYQAKNGGALPPEGERQRMAFQAATLMAAEQVGDVAALGLAKGSSKAAADTARTSFLASMKTAGKAAGTGFLTEAPTEGYQTWAEGEIKGKSATGAEIYTGAVIGGFSAAGLAGGGRALSEAASLASRPAAQEADKTYDPAKAAVVDAAIASGDVSGLIDPTKPAYAPDQAIRSLFGHSQLASTTDEAKQANLTKADEIIADLESERAVEQSFLKTPEDRQAEIDGLKTRMAAVDPTNTDMLSKFRALIAQQEEEMAEPALTGEKLAGVQARVSKLDGMVKEAILARDNLSELVQAKASVEDFVAQADKAADTAQDNTAAIDRVITLAMASPGRLDPQRATQLADNAGNALTAPQRAYLRTFSEARVAENQLMTMGGVSADIYHGKKNKGIAQYRAALGRALTAGRRSVADEELAGLEKFEQDHTAKATVAAQAISQGLGTQIVSDGQRGWSIPATPLAQKDLSKNGGLAINSGRLVKDITTEAAAITKAVAEMKSAYAIKFTAGETNVKNVSPKAPGSEPRSEAAQQPAATEAGPSRDAVKPQGVRAGAVLPASQSVGTDVEAAGVVVPVAPKEEANPARVIDLRRRISMLEKIRKCMGG